MIDVYVTIKKQLILILAGFVLIGIILSQMQVDISVAVIGKSIKGSGNLMVRSQVDGQIETISAVEGQKLAQKEKILQISNKVIADEVDSLKTEIIGAKSLVNSRIKTQSVYQSELKVMEELVEKGLEPKSELRKISVNLALSDASLIEAQGRLDVLESRLSQALDKLSKYEVSSPAQGNLLKLYRYSQGDFIKAGDLIAEIIPQDGELQFEAEVNLQDISSVAIGNPARVTLHASNRYEVKPKMGKVTYVSPSSLTNDKGESYFITRIKLDKPLTADDIGNVSTTGHSADISIKSGSRSVLAFVMSPLLRGSERVFQEQ